MKNPTFSGGGSRKINIEGGLPKNGGLGQFADLRGGGLGTKEGSGVFEGEGVADTPMHTMIAIFQCRKVLTWPWLLDHHKLFISYCIIL